MSDAQPKVYSEFRPAWHAFAPYMLGVVIFVAGPFINPQSMISPALGELIATCFAAFIFVKRYTNLYRVDAEKVTTLRNFPSAQELSLAIEDIGRVDLRRGMVQRLLGVAHVHIFRKGEDTPTLKLFGVAKPDVFKKLLLELGAQDHRVTGAWRK